MTRKKKKNARKLLEKQLQQQQEQKKERGKLKPHDERDKPKKIDLDEDWW
ncbi:MAG: hypothetical protein GY830_00735 [Bacteroidetes bacterium]|nr:hypothetical protein [Bacteroidota bacterium]